MLQISELYIYPIKSLPGISLRQARVTDRGFEHDRRWMLVDENNIFISQREVSGMTQLPLSLEDEGIRVTDKRNNSSFLVPFKVPAVQDKKVAEVFVWDDTCQAEYVGDEADRWFSKALGINCRLVHMPEDSRRIVDQKYAPGDKITSLADGYPFLLIGQASLDELNGRLTEHLPMNRFRPNIVFTGGAAFEEDVMAHLTIGSADFYGVKLCARCPIPTINQITGARGKEPLKTLAKYRQRDNKIYFGQNLIHAGEGIINVGDALEVKRYHTTERFFINGLNPKWIEIDKTLV
ncbi:MAG TPA: MOSC N-terminal beta barrel domain-containing protein [Mucilaginibacter sp.]|jgi:hypothetical protein|nr:MOSC N-terminal beta barrel domain-containing protein [Mucilaginibacter sp.]